MDEELKRKARQNLIDTAKETYGSDDSALGSMQNTFSGQGQEFQGRGRELSQKALDEAAIRNAKMNKQFMLQQIADERAKKAAMQPPVPVAPAIKAEPPVDMNDQYDQLMKEIQMREQQGHFKNLKGTMSKK